MIALAASLLLAAPQPVTSCDEGETILTSEFDGGHARDCVRTEDGFSIRVVPESWPINRSPWFAFDIASDAPADVTVRITYTHARHRYMPKAFRADGMQMDLPIETQLIDDGRIAVLRMTVPQGSTRIAAQQVISPDEHLSWSLGFAERGNFEIAPAGHSEEGRLLWRLSSRPDTESHMESRPLVLLLGGQHPPEVPGSLAMRHFLERIAANDALAARFRQNFAVEIYPLLNPDGIAAGNWRTAAPLKDMNREWGEFELAATALVAERLAARQAAGNGGPLALMIDFHATSAGDVFYVPSAGEPVIDRFMEGFTAELENRHDGPGFTITAGHNPGLPTARSWFTEEYGIPGLTLEIGDETPPARTRTLAVAAAEAIMLQLLSGRRDTQ